MLPSPLDLDALTRVVDPETLALLRQMMESERRVDRLIGTCLSAMRDRVSRPVYERRTLRLHCSHAMDLGPDGVPRSWMFRLAGHLEGDPRRPPHALSDLVRTIQVKSHAMQAVVYEWRRPDGLGPGESVPEPFTELCLTHDGAGRCGDTLDVTVAVHNEPERYRVPPALSAILRAAGQPARRTEFTAGQLFRGLRDYIDIRELKEADGPAIINDRPLTELFGRPRMTFTEMIRALKDKMLPAADLTFQYSVWDDSMGLAHDPCVFSLEVDVPSALDFEMREFLADGLDSDTLDACAAECQQIVRRLEQHRRRRDLLRALSVAPVDFCYFMACQPATQRGIATTDTGVEAAELDKAVAAFLATRDAPSAPAPPGNPAPMAID